MQQSESTAKLYEALTKAQSEFVVVPKTKTGVEGHRSFKYADLADVVGMVLPRLNKQGIHLSQPIVSDVDGNLRQTTRLTLNTEFVQTDGIKLSETVAGKTMGLQVTYARRIDLNGLLGISPDDDLDAPDLKPSSIPATSTTFKKPINTLEQLKVALPQVNSEITDADLPPFGDTNREPVVKLRPEDAALIDEISNFVPLSENRNRDIQNQLKEWVKNKTFSLRSLTTYLDKEHGGKKQFDVSAQQWEQTFSKISSAVDAGSDSIKQLLKG